MMKLLTVAFTLLLCSILHAQDSSQFQQDQCNAISQPRETMLLNQLGERTPCQIPKLSPSPARGYKYTGGDISALQQEKANKEYQNALSHYHLNRIEQHSNDPDQDRLYRVDDNRGDMILAVAHCKHGKGSFNACQDEKFLKVNAKTIQQQALSSAQEHDADAQRIEKIPFVRRYLGADRYDLTKDKKDLSNNRDARNDRRDLRQDNCNLARDKRNLRANARPDICNDRHDLRADRRDLHNDHRNSHGDGHQFQR